MRHYGLEITSIGLSWNVSPWKNNGCMDQRESWSVPVLFIVYWQPGTTYSYIGNHKKSYTDSSFFKWKSSHVAVSYHGCDSCEPTILHVHNQVLCTCNQPVGIQLLSKLEISMGQEPMNAWWGCFLSKESRNSVKVTCHRLNRPLTAPLLQERLYTSNFMAFASTVCSNFFLWKLTCWEMILWLKIFLL